jgi:hypothetical protein
MREWPLWVMLTIAGIIMLFACNNMNNEQKSMMKQVCNTACFYNGRAGDYDRHWNGSFDCKCVDGTVIK